MKDNKKIWGIYNTLNKDDLDNLSEYDIWKKIYLLSREIKFTLNYLERPGMKDISIKALIDEQFNLEYLMYYTTKFGVKFDKEPTFGEHIKQSKSFDEWYKKWQKHFKVEVDNKYRKELGLNKDNDNFEENENNIQLQKMYQ